MRKRGLFTGRTRQISVHIPQRYVLRESKANRVIWILLTPLSVFLTVVCAVGLLAAVWEFKPLAELAGVLFWFYLAGVLMGLGLLALMLVCPLLAVRSRKDSLTVDGERLALRRWLRKPVDFAFTEIAFVRALKGREAILIQGRDGRVLCRLSVAMEHMDILQADLRSRRVPFAERDGFVQDAFILSPGPRREDISLTLPDEIPQYYRLTHPPLFTGIFAALLVFTLGCMLFFGLVQGDPGVLLMLPFTALAVVGLVWVKMERAEILGDRVRLRNPLGKVTEFNFDSVAAVRISTTVTGIGPLSSMELLAEDGAILYSPGMWMPESHLLLTDLINRGIPFTY